MKMGFRNIGLLICLTSCVAQEETPVEIECVESLYCCAYTCVSEEEVEERGPDPCDCEPDTNLSPPDGACSAVDGVCDWR